MARETKAQRLEREKEERAARLEQQREEYPTRVLEVLSRAVSLGLEIKSIDVVKRTYTVYDRDRDDTYEVFADFGSAGQSQWSLTNLNASLDWIVSEREEAERKYQVRQAALEKLSPEERELLGV